jgi:DNA-binding transcriptional MerR regulator
VPYSTAQAARLAGCTVSQLRHWSRSELVVPSEAGGYSFRDLVALRVVRSLLDGGLSSARVRHAVDALRAIGDDDVARLRLVTDGRRVWACRNDGQILDALGQRQLALFVAVDRVAGDVASDVASFEQERAAFVDELLG